MSILTYEVHVFLLLFGLHYIITFNHEASVRMDDEELEVPQLVEAAWPETEIQKKIPVTVLCGCDEASMG